MATPIRLRGIPIRKYAELTKDDRCDRCPAAAETLAVMLSGNELLFCGHHTKIHHDALLDQGAQLYARG